MLGGTGIHGMTRSLLPRQDGHKQKAEGHYRDSDDIVKYRYWVVMVLVGESTIGKLRELFEQRFVHVNDEVH